MHIRSLIGCLVALVVVAGCGTQYKYGDNTYSSREEAVQAVRNDMSAQVAAVDPVSDGLGGSALAVVPTRDVLRAHGVSTAGPPDSDAVEYIVDVLEINFLSVVDSVKKGEVFDNVTLLRADDAEGALYDNYDYKLWLFSPELGVWQWYLSKQGIEQREPVATDMGLERLDRLNSFNMDVVRAARSLGG